MLNKYTNNKWVLMLIGVLAALGLGFILWFVFFSDTIVKAEATYIPKVNICHFDGESGNFQTLNVAIPASIAHLQQHDDDYLGVCQEVTPSVSPEPTEEPEPSVEPTQPPCEGDCEVVTPTPTTVPQNNTGGGNGDGKSDGQSDGKSDGKSVPQPTLIPLTWVGK